MKVKRSKAKPVNKKVTENHAPVPAGILIAIGGKENKGQEAPENKQKPGDFIKLEVLEAFRTAMHKREPLVEVITSASGEGAGAFDDYKRVFEKIGITNVGRIHHKTRQEVLDDDMADRIKAADAFFFSGGDQLLLTALYGGTRFLTQLKERYISESIVIGGTSAGAMALSTPMIYAGSEEVQELGGQIKVTMGLEFIKDVCLDTHFVHRGRFVRLAQVVITNPTSIGIGIEEDTCIKVQKGRQMQVIGTGLVMVIEGFDIREADIKKFGEDRPVSARNLSVHLLADGDEYEMRETNPPHK